MYSSEDLERFYFQYQTEAMPKGISIEQFCSRNKVPYNIFYKWYKDTRNKIVEVKVDGLPASCQKDPKEEAHLPEQSSNLQSPSFFDAASASWASPFISMYFSFRSSTNPHSTTFPCSMMIA